MANTAPDPLAGPAEDPPPAPTPHGAAGGSEVAEECGNETSVGVDELAMAAEHASAPAVHDEGSTDSAAVKRNRRDAVDTDDDFSEEMQTYPANKARSTEAVACV